jgi:hypothetical protein
LAGRNHSKGKEKQEEREIKGKRKETLEQTTFVHRIFVGQRKFTEYYKSSET